VANFRSASQSFLQTVRSVIEKVVAGTFHWARMKVKPRLIEELGEVSCVFGLAGFYCVSSYWTRLDKALR
jgi:hypothetical protein